MTTWHWIRHGPTHEKTFVGWRDVPADLSDTQQIEKLQAYLPKEALLVSSDLIRCSATADAIMGDGHERLADLAPLREVHFGVWDGMHFSDVAARDPDLSRAFWEDPGDIVAPEGESWNQTYARVRVAVDQLNATYPDRHIIAVAHFGVILTQVQRGLGVSAKEAMAHKIDNLSVTEIRHEAGAWSVPRINHLP
jgi:broad specificity phosphatase PhoE